MAPKFYALKSDKLKEVAVKIFGNIVENVFVVGQVSSVPVKKSKEYLELNEFYILENSENELSYNDKNIIIQFINGNFVFSENSEWAYMDKIEKSEFEII